MKLIRVSVMLCLKENQNMVLMIFAHILEKLVCFNFSCLVVVLLILLKNDDKKLIVQLEKYIKEKFPEYNTKFYSNHRNFYIHMGLDNSLFSFDNYQILLEEINNFLTEHLETKFSRVYPPKLIFSTRWKHDYIISKKNRNG